MTLEIKVNSALLLTLLLAGSGNLLAAQTDSSNAPEANTPPQTVDRNNPLAGTGIEPNVVGYTEPDYKDPLIRFNRAIFAFNDVSYRYVLIPTARAYQNTPAPLRSSIGNFFNNIKSPILIVNHLLQGKPQLAGVDFGRFIINSTVGIVGLFDPAANRFEMPREETSLSDTLIQYGTGYGSYLVLPFIGPSNLRDGSATFIDGLLNPLRYMDNPESIVVRVFDNFQEFSPAAEAYLTLSDESEDPYIFMRNLHLQGILRDAQYRGADEQLH
jgi:phospholipid-binding lipoprotein MlaA